MVCRENGCDRPVQVKSRWLCGPCYQRLWKADQLGPLPKPDSQPHRCDRHEPSTTCYVNCKCRCDGCRAKIAANERRRRRNAAYGRTTWVDAEPVRQHVRSLMAPKVGSARGMGWKRIARRAGVPESVVSRLLYGATDRPLSRKIRKDNADALLSVRIDLARGATIPAGPTRKMLAEMVDGGWCKAELGRILTGNPGTKNLQVGRTRTVTVANATAVQQLYRRWKAGEVVPRGKRHNQQHGPPSPFPATPATPSCETCGQPPWLEGRWCFDCYQAHRRTA